MISRIISAPIVVRTCIEWNKLKNLAYHGSLIGTPLFGQTINSSGEPEETTVVRAGIFDDMGILNERKPEVEIYTDSRLKWICPIEDALQFSGMLAAQQSD